MWYDAFILLVLLLFTWRGAVRGAVWQLAVIGAIVLCVIFAGQLTPVLEPHIPLQDPFRHWAAVGIVYLALSLLTFLAARQLRSWLERIKFEEYDRHWGAILGLVKGGGLVLALTCILVVLLPQSRPPIRESWTGRGTQLAIAQVSHLLPQELILALQHAFETDEASPVLDHTLDGIEPFELAL